MTRHMTKVDSLLTLALLALLPAVLVQAGSVGESVAGLLDPRVAGESEGVDHAKGGERDAGGLTNPPDKGSPRFERPLEVPDDPYLPNVPAGEDPITTPARVWVRGFFESIQVNVDSQGANIVGDAANEPSIAIDPTDPSRIVIGWRQFDSVASNFRQAGWAYSHDGGTMWAFPGVLEQSVFRSDPVLDSDSAGNFYYYSLHSVFGGDLFISRDGGLAWEGPIPAFGGDKEWMVVDRSGGIGDGNIYVQWSHPAGDFTRSTDGGQSFLQPIKSPLRRFWGTMAVGPGGELYVSGEEIAVARSLDAKDPLVATPTFDLVSFPDLGGFVRAFGPPNPGGLLGQVWIATDHSDTPTRGNVYILASVGSSAPDPLDVMFTRSSDGGATWSAPIRVNDDPVGNGAWQWFGTMSVAPNGRIDAVWNDTRNTGDPKLSEVFYSFSPDGGLTWSANIPITPVFDSHVGWPNQNKLGDYYHMISDDVAANLAYAATFNGEQDVYFLRITRDCNDNDIPDESDIASGTSGDCNGNLMPDECEPDCNDNGVADECDIAAGTSVDCNENGVPDECEPDEDCNGNEVPDECDIAAGTNPDCNENGVPDECDLAAGTSRDCNENGVPDECEPDCNDNGVADGCDIADGTSQDDNGNGVPDECLFVLFVDAGASPGGDGGSWATANRDLRDALLVAADASSLAEAIWVAAGTYTPAPPGGDRAATFQLVSGTAVYGGFAGGEKTFDERDPVANVTILSGDLNGNDGPDFANNDENSYHVVTGSETDATAVLDGFTITRGNANGSTSAHYHGGGMFNVGDCNPTLVNCTFKGNSADKGGGMCNYSNAHPTLANCTLSDNVADGTLGPGGGMYNWDNSNPTLTNCVFRSNAAKGGTGGGMNNFRSNPMLNNCTFAGNSADYGGGMFNTESTVALTNCMFADNSALYGGGIYNDQGIITLGNCTFSGNRAERWGGAMYNNAGKQTLNNCAVSGNAAVDSGGGIYGNQAHLTLVNCAFSENIAGVDGGGIYETFYNENTPILVNCILWDNQDSGGMDQSAQLHGGRTPAIDYSCIQGWTGAMGGVGNIDDDPMFADADGPDDIPGTADDDLRLSLGSPCINTGDPGLIPEPGASDLDGHARVLCGRVDMGAYEFGIGDFDCNGTVNLTDFQDWSACMTGPGAGQLNPGCEAFDFDAEDDVDLADFAGFQAVMGGM